MYSLFPSEELRAARARFSGYEISELHDHTGRAEYTAVLKPGRVRAGMALLVSAGTLDELVGELHDQSPPATVLRIPRSRLGLEGGGPGVS